MGFSSLDDPAGELAELEEQACLGRQDGRVQRSLVAGEGQLLGDDLGGVGATVQFPAHGQPAQGGADIAGRGVDLVDDHEGTAGVDEADQLPGGATGEIAVHGANVTREYFRRPEATRLAKVPVTPGSADVWHRMGDVGHLDEQGRLWFCGRMAHRVETAAGTLFTIPCEAIFNAHPRVRRSALVGVGARGAQRPVIVVELRRGDDREALDRLTAELLALGARHAHTAGIRDVLYHRAFPVDVRHNAKIRREDLAVWAARELGA